MAPAKPADLPANSGLSLADGGEAAETLVQRMLQNQAQQLSSIRFQLRPAELGHLDVQMQWRGDQLQLAFTAQQAAARDLIESYLPQLRQLMQDMGLQLAGVDVRLDSDMKEGAQRQLQQQLGQNPNQNQSQNPGQGAGQQSDQQASAQRDPQGQGHAGRSVPSAADGALETGNPEAGDAVSEEAGSRPRAVIDAFV
jgi:flagellar hook-length control protein FliK